MITALYKFTNIQMIVHCFNVSTVCIVVEYGVTVGFSVAFVQCNSGYWWCTAYPLPLADMAMNYGQQIQA